MSELVPKKPGRPQFVPTEEQMVEVRRLAGLGIPQDRIRQAIINPETGNPIGKRTLVKAFEPAILAARVETDAKIAGLLMDHCAESWGACRYWEESRRSLHSHTLPGPGVTRTSEPGAEGAISPEATQVTMNDLELARRIAFILEKARRELDKADDAGTA